MNLAGLVNSLLWVLGREADKIDDIMVFTVALMEWKKSACKMELIVLRVVKATAADPDRKNI